MKKIFNPNNESIKPKKQTHSYIKIHRNMLIFSKRCHEESGLQVGDFVTLAYDNETRTIYIEKTENKTLGIELKGDSNKLICVYARAFFDFFKLNASGSDSFEPNNIKNGSLTFKISGGLLNPKTKKKRVPFVRFHRVNRLAFSELARKAMDLQKGDIMRVFYNTDTGIAVLKKNGSQNINGFAVHNHTDKTFYLSTRLMKKKWNWPENSERMELKRGGAGEDENAFYFELPIDKNKTTT